MAERAVDAGSLARRRPTAAIATGLLTLAISVGAAIFFGLRDGSVTSWVESASSRLGTALNNAVSALPLGYAFGAGVVSAVNPCGFAMLPAYLGLYLGLGAGAKRGPEDRANPVAAQSRDVAPRRASTGRSRAAALRRAITVAALVSAGFILLFGGIGIALSAGAGALARAFPWAGLSVGIALIATGSWLMNGGSLPSGIAGRAAARVGAMRRIGPVGYFAFGIAYGIASLGCTLPVFLTVVAAGTTAGSIAGAALQFVLYGAGMGVVVLLLTLSMALFRGALVSRLRSALRYVEPAMIALLFLAGSYLVYYWLTAGGLL